jgi:hypothetical protein
VNDSKEPLKGPPEEKLGFRDVLAFVLAALTHVLPVALVAIAAFVILWVLLRLLL